ncbi:MAG: hypothetical protein KF833_09465 [Verrucomicrobiae bacterium]|nr:hypothetical protein [Verrucomicrobiae bacterium]
MTHAPHPLTAALLDPQAEGALVHAGHDATPEISATYSSLPADRMSWCRGFLGIPPLTLDLDLPRETFVASFQSKLETWLHQTSRRPSGSGPQGGKGNTDPTPTSVWPRLVELETRFVSICLEALDRWSREDGALVLWDIDETLVGSGARVRFLRPSSEAVLRHAIRHYPHLRHGVLSSLAPKWIPAAAALIATVLDLPGPFGDPEFRFSFRPALDRFDPHPWPVLRQALREAGLPDCSPGTFPGDWPFYVTEFSRVIALHFLRRRGWNVKVIDNDLNACFDPDNSQENQIGEAARHWLREMLGDTCATGPHWWPQDTEEWIIGKIREFGLPDPQ